MSLQVWLPLNGNLDNYGLANVTVTNNGATVNTAGKIGQCYYFNGGYLSVPIDFSSFNINECSMCVWVKFPTASSGNKQILNIGTSSGWTNIRFGILYRTGAAQAITSISDGTNYVAYNCNATITENQWNHIAAVYSNKKLQIYINGILANTLTTTYDISFNGISSLGVGAAPNGAEKFTGYLNDVRIYNNALSTKEVKELAKGLVLHYPLSRPLPNLIADFDTSFQSYADGAVTLFTNQMNGGTQEIVSNIAGASKCLHLRSEGSSNRQYRTIAVSANKSYTISVDYYSTVAQPTSSRGELNGGNYSWLGSAASYTTPGQWQRISYTYTSLTSNATLYFFIYCSQGTDCYVKNFKVEEGTVATPWMPNVADTAYSVMGYNNNIEYDCSGYKNNGTRVGTFSWSNDTPRYNSSLVFSGSQYIVEPNEITTTDSTIALWVKSSLNNQAHILDARNDSGVGKQPIYQYTNGSIQAGGSAAYVASNAGLLVANTWVHVALVQSGNSLLIYKNGNLFQTISCTNSPVIKPTLGARFNFINIFNGQLSDFRIYATALSAEAIKELYDTPVSIADNGTMLTHGEFVES